MEKGGATYILTNKRRTTLYVGATSDLVVRIMQHKTRFFKDSFSDRYNIHTLVWFETFHTIEEAYAYEKKIKGWKKEKKIALINAMNPEWKDLWEVISKW